MLPTDPKERKATPILSGFINYFPDVFGEVARVSVLGHKQHNLSGPLHWERGVSTDLMDSAVRHIIDHSAGNIHDTDGAYHLAKAIWRLCAQLQLTIEEERAEAQIDRHEDGTLKYPALESIAPLMRETVSAIFIDDNNSED